VFTTRSVAGGDRAGKRGACRRRRRVQGRLPLAGALAGEAPMVAEPPKEAPPGVAAVVAGGGVTGADEVELLGSEPALLRLQAARDKAAAAARTRTVARMAGVAFIGKLLLR
jgi:hypothetical protein